MRNLNELGFYPDEHGEDVARVGRAFASVAYCQCAEDGLFRYALTLQYSYGGATGPIFASYPGFETMAAAREAALTALLNKLAAMAGNGDPESAQREVRGLREQIATKFRQPSLF